MSLQMSVAMRNSRCDAIETRVGTAPRLRIYSGSVPANCAASDPSGLLATIVLPSDWLAAASSGAKTLLGSWTVAASGTGVAASWRIFDSAIAACEMQGTVTATGGGGDLTLDNTNIASGQTITITAFTLTEGNA